MNNRYGDNRYGDDRWRDQGGRDEHRGGYGRERGGQDDRGFFDRAGDEVRSWFGDEEAEHRREADERRWERERGMTGRRDNQYGGDNSSAYMGTGGGGWGNEPDSWNRERPGMRGGEGAYGAGDRSRESSDRYGAADTGGGSSFGGSGGGRRFDRVDVGSTGTHGAHPRSAPVGGGSVYGAGYGISANGGGTQSSARYAGHSHGGGSQGGMMGDTMGAATAGGVVGSGMMGDSSSRGRDLHDPHYSQWRSRQIDSLDRDYEDYRREHQSKFEQDFGNWRSKRGEQRQSMSKVTEHMEVVGSDGEKIGIVDCVKGDRIVLTKNDENAGGIHHSIPCGWIESVDDKVTVNKSKDEAMHAWRDEDRSRALFEREDSGSEGPHMLNRSFSGTYEDR